jgi:tetratricopeptide (TPR) repeat protein
MTAASDAKSEPVGPSRARRTLGLLVSPIAGLGHLLVLGNYVRGTVLGAGFVFAWSLVAAGSFAWTGPGAETLQASGWALLAGMIALSVGDAAWWLLFVDHARRRKLRDTAFRQGLAHAMRNERDEAVRSFREALRLDPREPALRFHLGVALWRVRRPRAARRHLLRCVRWDPERTWADEVTRQLEIMRGTRAPRRARRPRDHAE